MMIFRYLATLVISLSLLISPAQAEEWGTVKGWKFLVVGRDSQTSCFARHKGDDDLTVIIMVSPSLQLFLLSLQNPLWKNIKEDEKYPVELYFDDRKANGTMTGLTDQMVSSTLTDEAIKLMLLTNTMKVTYKGELLGKFDFDYNFVGIIKALEKCQKALNPDGWPWGPKKPDPFRR
ncbi:MAG: hypothetical protein Q8N31_09785 [Reyranella sp.]|nr:hypothetical protein [Reyranella sp.]MDP3160296.1 hypothetical protein [Reyranella sp.]